MKFAEIKAYREMSKMKCIAFSIPTTRLYAQHKVLFLLQLGGCQQEFLLPQGGTNLEEISEEVLQSVNTKFFELVSSMKKVFVLKEDAGALMSTIRLIKTLRSDQHRK